MLVGLLWLLVVTVARGEDPPPPSGSVRPPNPEEGTASQPAGTGSTANTGTGVTTFTFSVVDGRIEDDGCGDLAGLEAMALLGTFTEGHVACLELLYLQHPAQREAASRLLLTNWYARGDMPRWEAAMKRHLEQVDDTDPDLTYRYVMYLSKRGAARAADVIEWADVALAHRSEWTGDTYATRVYGLHKLRAAAAQSLWKAAIEEGAPDVQDARVTTLAMAREWHAVAAATGKDSSAAAALCAAAGGAPDCAP